MSTQDGYNAYSVGLTALQAKNAIQAAHNLSTTLGGYVKYTASTTAPLFANAKDGDLWLNTTTNILYRAVTADSDGNGTNDTLFWFEV